MWSSAPPRDDRFIGKILQQLHSGKSLGHILLESADWTERARILLSLKKIRSCYAAFGEAIIQTNGPGPGSKSKG